MASINLSPVPTATCTGNNALTGTATFSTVTTIPTGAILLAAGDYWSQAGAVWDFDTDTTGMGFSKPGIPGAGANPSIPQADIDAFLWTNGTNSLPQSWTLNVTIGCEPYDISFQAQPHMLAAPYPTPTAYDLTMSATFPCSSVGGIGLQPSPTPTGGSPVLASQCSNGNIPLDTQAWSTYEASSYMASKLNSAAPSWPTTVNAAALFADDAGQSGEECVYNKQCNMPVCKDIKDASTGALIVLQRYLAYASIVNFSNYWYSLYDALSFAGVVGTAQTAQIVTTFYTDLPPEATWEQVAGTFTPLLGVLSSFLGPFSGVASSLFGIASGIAGSINAAGTLSSLAPVEDKRFDEAADIGGWIATYLKQTELMIEHSWSQYLGSASDVVLTGSIYAPEGQQQGILGSGDWVDNNYADKVANTLQDNLIKIVTYRSINFAWQQSNVFIIWAPYDVEIRDADGKSTTINEAYCTSKFQPTDADKVLTVCNAPGNGMARIYNANGDNKENLVNNPPQGWDSNFNIWGSETLSTSSVITGSVNSWLTGDFNYTADQPYQNVFTGGSQLSDDQATKIANLEISQTAPGFFNLPVCRTLDLRTFPLPGLTPGTACGCSSSSAVGGTQGSTALFKDNVDSAIIDFTNPTAPFAPNCGEYSEFCMPPPFERCPGDLFTG